ncbi:MAG: HNH endonuclease signature motif containing protein [Acidobacteria bacterium]|nr:HNH endonuclease signature motif containing protein [Acidobacteriota bacterium]
MYSLRKALNRGSHSRLEWERKLAEYDSCPECGRRWEEIPPRPDSRYTKVWTKDHIVPLNKGGTDNIENIQPLCYRCNFAKCDRP